MVSLVTGGAGFIGSHLCEALAEQGDSVIILDDLSTGCRENIEYLSKQGLVEFIEGTVLDADLVSKLVERADRIFHLAAAVGVKLVLERPLHTARVNIWGSHNVLEAAIECGGKTLLLASTSEVYGKQNGECVSEDSLSLLGPVSEIRWIYGASKLIDEYLAQAYLHGDGDDAGASGIRLVTVRFFNVTGPRQTGAYGMVVPRFVQAALRGDPLTVYGDGKQIRCFCHVKDVVRAVMRLVEQPSASGQVFNVGSDEPVTIAELAERVLRITDSDSSVVYIPYSEAYGHGVDDVARRVPDLTKLRKFLGFQHRYCLDDIVREMAEYYAVRGDASLSKPS